MGTVYRAVDETLHREVAIKVLNAELNDPGIGRRFRAEAVAIARLNHPGIATIYELVQHEGQWLMVIEFVRGETLESLVQRSGPLPAEQAAEVCMQVLSALAHAHAMGVIHRDLKPANVMHTDAGATKVMDFGIARVAGTEQLTSAGFMMGTPAYMAPEQVLAGAVDARTDLYAMGVVLYFLATARLPFKGDTPMAMAQARIKDLPTPIRAVRPELPAWLAQISERALSKAIERRFQTADEFREALRRGVSGLAIDTLARPVFSPELVVTAEPGAMRAPETAPSAPATVPPVAPALVDSPATVPPATGPLLTPASAPIPPAASASTDPHTLPTVLGPIAVAAKPPTLPPDAIPAAPPTSSTPRTAAAPAIPNRAPAPRAAGATWNTTTLAIAGGVALLVIAGAVFAWRAARGKTPPPTASSEVSSAPAPAPAPAPVPPAPTSTTPDATVPPPAVPTNPPAVASGSGATGAPPATPPRGSGTGASGSTSGSGAIAPTGSGTAPPTTTPGVPAGTGPGAPTGSPAGVPPGGAGTGARASRGGRAVATDSVLRVDNLKLLALNGRQGTERDALLYFGGGLISITSRTGEAIASIQYKDLALATYVRAKDPKWDEALAGPPSNLDVPGGIFRSNRHWLVLQTRTAYAILRLEDDNWQGVIDTLAARTGVRIVQPAR